MGDIEQQIATALERKSIIGLLKDHFPDVTSGMSEWQLRIVADLIIEARRDQPVNCDSA
jgi:hypothetical protein